MRRPRSQAAARQRERAEGVVAVGAERGRSEGGQGADGEPERRQVGERRPARCYASYHIESGEWFGPEECSRFAATYALGSGYIPFAALTPWFQERGVAVQAPEPSLRGSLKRTPGLDPGEEGYPGPSATMLRSAEGTTSRIPQPDGVSRHADPASPKRARNARVARPGPPFRPGSEKAGGAPAN